MNRKCLSIFHVLLIIMGLSIALLCSGCGILGGAKEKPEPVTEVKTMPKATPAPQAKPSTQYKLALESEDESDIIEEFENGYINWSKGFIMAKGYGFPQEDMTNKRRAERLAYKVARNEALANILLVTEGIRLTAKTTAKDIMIADDTTESGISGTVKGSRTIDESIDYDEKGNREAVVWVGAYIDNVLKHIPEDFILKNVVSPAGNESTEWKPDGKATLRKIARDYENLKEIVEKNENLEITQKLQEKLDKQEKLLADQEQKLKDMSKESTDQNDELNSDITDLKQQIETMKEMIQESKVITDQRLRDLEDAVYSGIIIDASGRNMVIKAFPSIYYYDGDEEKYLYGRKAENRASFTPFESTLTTAELNERVKPMPYRIVPKDVDPRSCSFEVSLEHAQKIEKLNQELGLLKDGKVVIVCDIGN